MIPDVYEVKARVTIDGKKHTSRHTSFKLIAVNRVCEVDIK